MKIAQLAKYYNGGGTQCPLLVNLTKPLGEVILSN